MDPFLPPIRSRRNWPIKTAKEEEEEGKGSLEGGDSRLIREFGAAVAPSSSMQWRREAVKLGEKRGRRKTVREDRGSRRRTVEQGK